MKNLIYVFSSTGNSLFVAKEIKSSLKNTEIIRVTDKLLKNNISISCDKLGFIFPVHTFGPPVIINRLLKSIKNVNAKYLFVIETHGSGSGNTLKIFSKMLTQRNVDSMFSLFMPSNNIARKNSKEYGIDARSKIDKSNKEIKVIIEKIMKNEKTSIPKTNLPYTIFSKTLYPLNNLLYKPVINKIDNYFNVSSKCNGCGICVKICSFQNISLNNKKPTWHHNCALCLGCIQLCPNNSIDYKNLTVNKSKYKHPGIKIEEMFIN